MRMRLKMIAVGSICSNNACNIVSENSKYSKRNNVQRKRRIKKMNAKNFFNFNNTAVNKETDLGERLNDSPIS